MPVVFRIYVDAPTPRDPTRSGSGTAIAAREHVHSDPHPRKTMVVDACAFIFALAYMYFAAQHSTISRIKNQVASCGWLVIG